jgi:hypothetical protein
MIAIATSDSMSVKPRDLIGAASLDCILLSSFVRIAIGFACNGSVLLVGTSGGLGDDIGNTGVERHGPFDRGARLIMPAEPLENESHCLVTVCVLTELEVSLGSGERGFQVAVGLDASASIEPVVDPR